MKLIPGLDSAAVGWVRISSRRRVAVYDMDRVRNALEATGMETKPAALFAELISHVEMGRDTPWFVEPADARELRDIEAQERAAAAQRKLEGD
jgi:hypothetical protein